MSLSVRTEGFSSKSLAPIASWELNDTDISKILGKRLGLMGSQLAKNTEHYINARIQKSRSPQPEYILSPVGITDHPQKFGWSWFPPARGVYTVFPKGRMRLWTYIFMHSYGYSWDMEILKKNSQRRFCPGDEYGHHPLRWMRGIQQLCALNSDPQQKRQGKASIHFCISRRGDVVNSVDLNDVAWHGKGETLFTPKGNNYYSVGIELEPALGRYKYSNGKLSSLQVLPYPDRQLLALAIVCKKLVVYRGEIREVYITKQKGSVRAQADTYGSGYIAHIDVNSKKLDPRGQFSILPGEKGTIAATSNPFLVGLKSGWDQLWDFMRPMRFNLATDIFIKDVGKDIFGDMVDISVSMLKSMNAGQRAVIQQQRDRLLALHRAANMQSQERRFIYKQAMGQSTTFMDILAKGVAGVTQQVQRFSVANVKGVGGPVQDYDFETGTWRVGGVDTGKSV